MDGRVEQVGLNLPFFLSFSFFNKSADAIDLQTRWI
jgi:hypothetical protein